MSHRYKKKPAENDWKFQTFEIPSDIVRGRCLLSSRWRVSCAGLLLFDNAKN